MCRIVDHDIDLAKGIVPSSKTFDLGFIGHKGLPGNLSARWFDLRKRGCPP
jgi:hypothetical protein